MSPVLMPRSAVKVLLLLPLAVAGWAGLWLYEGRTSAGARESHVKAEAEQKSARLRGIAGRLNLDTRVARVVVTDGQSGPDGTPRTTLLWLESTPDGRDLLAARRFVLEGTSARVTGQVLRFLGHYAAENEPLAAHSLLLFKGIAGDKQAAKGPPPIDPPGGTPGVYKGNDPRLAQAEAAHWQDFWKLANDPQYAAATGVQVLDAEATLPEGFQRGALYTVTLSADGRLHVHETPAAAEELKAIEQAGRRDD